MKNITVMWIAGVLLWLAAGILSYGQVAFENAKKKLIDFSQHTPELRSKHNCMFRLGHAIAPEYITGNWLVMKPFPMRLTGQGVMMTPEERAMWLEHNTYYALRSSDEYAWTWTEGINWWTGEELPPGYKEAVLRAKQKVALGQPLGFEIDELIKKSQDKAEEFYNH